MTCLSICCFSLISIITLSNSTSSSCHPVVEVVFYVSLAQDVLHQIIALLPVPHENFYGPGDIILSSNSVPKHYPWMDNTIVYKVKWIHISRGLILLCKTTLVVG